MMSWSKHDLRSTRISPITTPLQTTPTLSPMTFTSSQSSSQLQESIQIHPPGSKLPGLKPQELNLLHKKQSQLKATASSLLSTIHPSPYILNALSATLIFAQHEAGTAVCVDPRGYILTCSHCIAETAEEWAAPGDTHKRKWLLYYTGLAVQVECRAWDPKRDLALLKIIAIELPALREGEIEIPSFTFVPLAAGTPSPKEAITCIGQPGRDDLESNGNKRTKYNLIELSEGRLRGMVSNADPQDNSEIGTLKHDAWTYWGHSGAPLLGSKDGALVGLHSSWDDQTAMRHGIPLLAIVGFLREHLADVIGLNVVEQEDAAITGASAYGDKTDAVRLIASSGRRSSIEPVDLTGSSP